MRSTLRSLLRTPTLTLATVATMALGIGSTTAMFAVVYGVLLRPLPYPDAGRLVMVWEKWQVNRDMKGVDPTVAAALAERSVVMTTGLDVWQKENRVFEGIAGFTSLEASLTGGGEPERVPGLVASSSLFPILGVTPALGRAFTTDEDRAAQDEVVVLSHALWMRRFAGDAAVLGRTVGVMPGLRSRGGRARDHRPLRRHVPVGGPARKGDRHPHRARGEPFGHRAVGHDRRADRGRSRGGSRARPLSVRDSRPRELPV
jgi:MacB-like protein